MERLRLYTTHKEKLTLKANDVLAQEKWWLIGESEIEIRQAAFSIGNTQAHLSQVRKTSEPQGIHNRLQYHIDGYHEDFQQEMYEWSAGAAETSPEEVFKLANASKILNDILANIRTEQSEE